jgi:hypothetical protein
MQNFDELGQAIRDRQVRYHHEAQAVRRDWHPMRVWLGSHLVQLGEAIRGQSVDRGFRSGNHPAPN